ncbi:MAG: hypothetical protein ACOCQY_04025 [Halorhabdus sp.]
MTYLMSDTDRDDSKSRLTWREGAVASGILVVNLAIYDAVNGAPATIADWALLGSTAMFAGVVGYKIASRTFDTTLGITVSLLVLNFLLFGSV